MHLCSSVCRLRCCIEDLVEFSDRLLILSGKLLRSTFILASLLEGHNHLIFTHVKNCVTDLVESADEVLKMLVGLLNIRE